MKLFYNLKQIYKGLAVIALIAGILLYADKHNRHPGKTRRNDVARTQEIKPEVGKIYKIGVAYFAPEEGFDNVMKGFYEGMRQLGFVKDSNLKIVMAHCNAEIANIPSLLQNLDNQDIDLIFPTSTPVIQGSFKAVKNKPVVFTYCYDPLSAGAGKSATDHLPHVTGVGSFPPIEETFDFIQQLVPGVKSIGTLYNSSESNSRKVIEEARKILKKRGIKLEEITVTNTNEVFQAAQVLVSKDIQVVWVTGDNTAIQAIDGIVKNTDKARLPLVVNDQEMVAKGATAAVGVGWYSTGFHSATMTAQVLLGANPKDIPIENFVEKDIIINHEKIKQLGLKVPAKVLRLADYGISEFKPGKKLKLALVMYNDAPISESSMKGILDGLKEVGLEKGRDFEISIQNAQGDLATLNNIIDNVADGNYDLIFVTSTPTLQVISKKIKNIPVVFTCVADPVAAGAGKSFEVHQSNITGISTMGNYKGGIECFKNIMPKLKRVGTLYTPGEVNSVVNFKTFQKMARQQNVEVIGVPVSTSSEVMDAALSLATKNIDAICQIIDNLTSGSFASIIQAGHKAKIPVFGFVSEQATDGAVAVVARNYVQGGKDAVRMAVTILNGKHAADIPFRYVSKSEIILNQKAADLYRIKFQEDMKKSAAQIIKK